MTLRNASLTAVAALTVALAGGALAQDAGTAAAPADQQGTAAPAPDAPSATSVTPAEPAGAAPEAQPSSDASPAAEPAAPDATGQAGQPAAEAPVAQEPVADAPAGVPATEGADQQAPAADQQPADAAGTPAADQPAPGATQPETAAPVQPSPAEEQAQEQAPATTAPVGESGSQDAGAPAAGAADAAAERGQPAEAPADAAPEAAPPPAAPAAEGQAGAGGQAPAAHAAAHIEDVSFSFEGPFGKFDQFQLQRGLQVYTEVCSACHGLRYVPLRTLGDPGGPALPEDQVRAYAAILTIIDEETGEERPRTPTDHFPTVTGEGMGPDLSLMAKARAGFHGPYGTGINQLFRGIGGPEYIHAILTGFDGETKEEAGSTFYHNPAFSTGWIKMPPPLSDGQVTYEDGTQASVDQMSRDVAAFLMWAAEPKMMARKETGFVSVLFLIVLASLLYLTNKRLWWSVKHGRRKG